MRLLTCTAVLSLVAAGVSFAQSGTGRALLDQYSTACHNDQLRQGDLSLTEVDPDRPAAHAPVLEKVARKLRAGLMPPPGRPRPDADVLERFIRDLETTIDADAARAPNPGRPVLHRLNRTEYANVVRDLVGLEVRAETLLPPATKRRGG